MSNSWGTPGGLGGGGSSGGAAGSRPAVGWKDGVGWLDAEGNPTDAVPSDFHGSDNPGHVFTDTKAPPVNLSDGNPNTSTSVITPGGPVIPVGGNNGGNVTTYRAGVDDRPWTNVAQPSAYLYGGVPGGASAEVGRYSGLAAASDGRLAPQISGNAYGQQLGADLAQEAAARGNQQYGLGQLQGIIEGRGPSVAQQQQNMGLAQAMQQQRAIAGSARGGGANMAAAQQAAANAAAGLSGNAFAQGGLLRAQETMGAINAYGGAANAIRGNDQARAQLVGQLANSQASLDLQNRNANDSRNLAYEQMRRGVYQDQMGARQAGEAMNNGIIQQNADRSQRADEHADAERDKYIGAGLAAGGAIVGTMIAPGAGTAAGAAIGSGISSDVRAKTNIGDGADAVRATIGAAVPYTYDYKDPAKDGDGRRIGVMAQDLERGPLGSQLVRTGPDGKKVIDGPRGLSLALASSADQEHRLRQLEAASGLSQVDQGMRNDMAEAQVRRAGASQEHARGIAAIDADARNAMVEQQMRQTEAERLRLAELAKIDQSFRDDLAEKQVRALSSGSGLARVTGKVARR